MSATQAVSSSASHARHRPVSRAARLHADRSAKISYAQEGSFFSAATTTVTALKVGGELDPNSTPKASSAQTQKWPAATSNARIFTARGMIRSLPQTSNANEVSVSRQALRLLRPEAKEAGSMSLEPRFGALRINRQAADRGPERGGMVHMQEMRCFMRREIIEDETRRQDQAPGKAERAR